MANWITCLVVIGLGALVLVVAWNGHKQGEIPAGCNGLTAYRPNRDDNPIAFHTFLALYFVGGMALVVWGILSMFGSAAPIPLY